MKTPTAQIVSAEKQRADELKRKMAELMAEYETEEIKDILFTDVWAEANYMLLTFGEEKLMQAVNQSSESKHYYSVQESDTEVCDRLKKDGYLVFEDEDSMHRYLRKSAYMIFKPENLQQEMQFRDFAETVFPFYHDQQMCIL